MLEFQPTLRDNIALPEGVEIPSHVMAYHVLPFMTGRNSNISPLGGQYVVLCSGGEKAEGAAVPKWFDTSAEATSAFNDQLHNALYGKSVVVFRAVPRLDEYDGKFNVYARYAAS